MANIRINHENTGIHLFKGAIDKDGFYGDDRKCSFIGIDKGAACTLEFKRALNFIPKENYESGTITIYGPATVIADVNFVRRSDGVVCCNTLRQVLKGSPDYDQATYDGPEAYYRGCTEWYEFLNEGIRRHFKNHLEELPRIPMDPEEFVPGQAYYWSCMGGVLPMLPEGWHQLKPHYVSGNSEVVIHDSDLRIKKVKREEVIDE